MADAGDLKSPEVIPHAGSNPASPILSDFPVQLWMYIAFVGRVLRFSSIEDGEPSFI